MSTTTTRPEPLPGDVSHGTTLKANSLGFVGIAFFVIAARGLRWPRSSARRPRAVLDHGPRRAAVIMVAVVIALFAVGYLRMSRHIVHAGSFVAYIARGWASTRRPALRASSSSPTSRCRSASGPSSACSPGSWRPDGSYRPSGLGLGPCLHRVDHRARDAQGRPRA